MANLQLIPSLNESGAVCMGAVSAFPVQYGCSMSTGCLWTISEVVGSIPHKFNRLQNHGGSPWTSLEVILGTVNPLVGGSNPSRGASKINILRLFLVNLLRYSRVAN
jgi:hypothetical protein